MFHPEIEHPEGINKRMGSIEVLLEVDRHFGFMVIIDEVVLHDTTDNDRVKLTEIEGQNIVIGGGGWNRLRRG